MRFNKFIVEQESSKIIKNALKIEDPANNKEYIKDTVTDNIYLLEYAVSTQKKLLMKDDSVLNDAVLSDLLKKLRKWKQLFKDRWPDDSNSDGDLSPKPAKPHQPPIGMDSKLPIDLLNKVQGNTPEESTKAEK